MSEYNNVQSLESKINVLFDKKIIIPITDEFLRYHKETERYDLDIDTKTDIKSSKKDSTKIRYIINKISTASDLYNKGQKSESNGVDIIISGRNGDVCITAEKNGRVRIRAQNIMIDADEDVDIKAGRNITLDSGSGRLLIKANKADCDALDGNLIPPGTSFGEQVFSGSFVGADIIAKTFSGGLTSIIGL
jgi:hypothetical protein